MAKSQVAISNAHFNNHGWVAPASDVDAQLGDINLNVVAWGEVRRQGIEADALPVQGYSIELSALNMRPPTETSPLSRTPCPSLTSTGHGPFYTRKDA